MPANRTAAELRSGQTTTSGPAHAADPQHGYLLVNVLVAEDGEQGHPADVRITRIDITADGAPTDESVQRLVDRITSQVRDKVTRTRRPSR